MKKRANKYFIIVVSMLLVLSNFSFATQQMLCLMSSGDNICSCINEETENPQGVFITGENFPCCSTKTIELSNNNNLQKTVNELPKDIASFQPLLINLSFDESVNSFNFTSYTSLKEHVPRSGIPILISSLLI